MTKVAGSAVGGAMGQHMDIGVPAFTGSGATGRRILESSPRPNMKRCYLERGGKSPNAASADTPDLELAVPAAANGIFRDPGTGPIDPSTPSTDMSTESLSG